MTTKPMTAKRKAELKRDIKSFCDALRHEGADFSIAAIFPGSGKHDGVEHISAKDDHHMLDLINNQVQLWSALNHKEKKP